jgi:alpha-beta hydrolase superfamily lysophospholipase
MEYRMNHMEYEWVSQEKKGVFAQSWLPEDQIKGIICLIHGLGEHSGRYARWAELFVQAGYGMMAVDLPGHGRTEGRLAYVKSYEDLLDCVDLLIRKSEDLFPGSPRILYGHSMGGNIVINYAISREAPVKALIASSPWLRLTFRVSPFDLALGKLMNNLLPCVRFRRKGTNAERLSHDPEHWADVRADPLNHGLVTGRYFWIIHRQGGYALKNAGRIKIPFLLMHGSDDKVTSPGASEEFAAGSGDQTLFKLWEGLYHELHWEFEYQDIGKFVIDWLDSL